MTDKYDILMLDDAALLAQCRVDVFVGTGRGGQKRNKTSTAVRLTHPDTGCVVSDDTSRSQHQNRGYALRKLRLAIAMTPTGTMPTAMPDMTSVPCEKSTSYPQWVAALFDVLYASHFVIHDAADALGCSSSKLTRVLQKHPILWQKTLQFINMNENTNSIK